MVNTKRGRFTSAIWRALGVFLLSVPLGTNAVEISNGVPDGTVGSYRVDLETGGGTRMVVVTAARFASNDIATTNMVRNYYAFADPGNDGFGSRLLGSPPVLDPNNPNIVTSNGSFFNSGKQIFWTAVSSIAPGAQVLTNTYTFSVATGVLGPLRVLQHLDKNTLITLNDVFSHTGSTVGGDLELFTFDNTEVFGLSHSGTLLPGTELQNASFAGWAADRFDNIVTSIFAARQPVSPAGIIANLSSFRHPQLGPVSGPEDIVSVLAWDVDPNATTAVITTFLRAIPISVEVQPVGIQPGDNQLVGNQLRCRGRRCRFRVGCLAPDPVARCTNRINVTVTKKALGLRGGASRVQFASGAAALRSGQNGIVQLPLTKRARNFVGSTRKKTIRGIVEIQSIDGVAVNVFQAKIRLN